MAQTTNESRIGVASPAPIVFEGRRYEEIRNGELIGQNQRTGLMAIHDNATNARLALVSIYDTKRDPNMEADVQDVFFRVFTRFGPLPEGIEKLDEIISTPGVDAAYIGPTDLALALGLPPVMDNDDPKHVATVNRILEACKQHKKIAGIYTTSSKFTQRYLDQGFQMVMLGTDRSAMSNYMKAEIGRLTGWTPLTPGSGPNTGGY